MWDIIRDSTFGQFVNLATNGRVFPFEDQRPEYVVPARFLKPLDSPMPKPPLPRADSNAPTLIDSGSLAMAISRVEDPEKAPGSLERASSQATMTEKYQYLVEFEENDPDRPHNWSRKKRLFVSFLIAYLTFSVYIGSAIYTSSIPGVMAHFGVSQTVATLGLSLFVFAYGLGPMFLAPMQEMATVGRNPPYMLGLLLFVIFQIPIILAPNITVLLVFRALSGFVGSPALATGGGSMGDIFSPKAMPIAVGIWSVGAVLGPILGPVIGGFPAQLENWRWPNLELLWITGFAFIVLFVALPETYEPTILVRRAERLRKLTGNKLIKTQAELDAIPAFPLVFNGIYGFNLGLSGLPFLSFVVSGVITFTVYVWYQKKYIIPRAGVDPTFQPEDRLRLALFGSVFSPLSLFIFGWTARPGVHWIGPTIGAALYLPAVYLAFQSILMYCMTGYTLYAASILAGNAFFRSAMASGFPLFGHAFYDRLTIGGGCSLLAGLSILMIIPLFGLFKYGDRLRARSKWT
ncbi:hypothetical protein OIV83_001646 [Microbotryomycetes sp. JL201]|nr:hypothetical protein OIV83_001646 [Microbotryomycetes sp. JL201]